MEYLKRSVDRALDSLMEHAPAVALEGPRGTGKTATASRRSRHVWNMEFPTHRAQLDADHTFSGVDEGAIFIDEWQNHQDSWNAVRRAVDAGAPGGRFLLAGSATPKAGQGTHSGAGRILSSRMRPLGLHERGIAEPAVSLTKLLNGEAEHVRGETDFGPGDYYEAIVSSGFPGIFDRPAQVRRPYLESYLQRVIDRDLPGQARATRKPETFRRWLRAYAAASSTTATQKSILETAAEDGEAPSKKAAIGYRDYLSSLWLLDPVDGWSPAPNPFVRMKETQLAQKHQLADPALAAHLLGMTSKKLSSPAGADMAGKLFESLVTLTIRSIAEAESARVGHLRTYDGRREVDLIVEGIDGQVLAVEVKLSPNFGDRELRHLKWFRDELGEEVADLVVITTGPIAFRRRDGIAVVPLALLAH